MAQDNKDKNGDGTRCLTATELVTMRAHYDAYAIETQSGGEEPLGFEAWLNSKGLRNCYSP